MGSTGTLLRLVTVLALFYSAFRVYSSFAALPDAAAPAAADPFAGMSPARRLVEETLARHRVAVFSKSYCPYSQRAKEIISKHRVAFHAVELDRRDDGADVQDALAEMTGARTVPRVFVDGEFIGGADETGSLDASGRLRAMLAEKGLVPA